MDVTKCLRWLLKSLGRCADNEDVDSDPEEAIDSEAISEQTIHDEGQDKACDSEAPRKLKNAVDQDTPDISEAIGKLKVDDDVKLSVVVREPSPIRDWNREFALASDWFDEEQPVTEEEMAEYENILETNGFNALKEKINKENNTWKNVVINIAIAGGSGSGKSSFINAIRNLKHGDEGAADIGCTETTKGPTPYSFKSSENVKIWDLPGVGTPNFPQETYLETINFEKYDFIILITSSRFTENDAWLANEINGRHPLSNLIFIRTKVDSDIRNCQMGNRKLGRQDQFVEKIRDECTNYLKDKGLKHFRIFLINSYRTDTFDFMELFETLIQTASELKREAMIMSLSSLSKNVVAEKKRILQKRMRAIAVTGAMAAINSKRSMGQRSELEVLLAELLFYQQQLGLDAHSISVLATMLHKSEEEIYLELMIQSHILRTEKEFANMYDQFDTFTRSFYHYVPYFGKRLEVRNYQYQCTGVLKFLLKICSLETSRLQTNLAIWLDK